MLLVNLGCIQCTEYKKCVEGFLFRVCHYSTNDASNDDYDHDH